MDDLVAWLRQQLDDDERAAKTATEGPWQVGESGEVETVALYGTPGYERHLMVTCDGEGILPAVDERDAAHIAAHDPARVLREVEAKRALIEEVMRPYLGTRQPSEYVARLGLRLLALPYADRPGYREEWKP